MLVDEPKEVNAEPEVFSNCLEILEAVPSKELMISLHALLGTGGSKLCVFKVALKITRS